MSAEFAMGLHPGLRYDALAGRHSTATNRASVRCRAS
jgi:hypothetical protein